MPLEEQGPIGSGAVYGGDVEEQTLVSFFINPSSRGWDVQKLKRCVSDQEVKVITSIPLSKFGESNKLIWHYTKNGVYSVKSGYYTAREIESKNINSSPSSSFQPPPSLWKLLWNLNISPKVKHFWWRACRNILATKENLYKRKCLRSPHCPLCLKAVESIEHLLFQCKKTKPVWDCCNLSNISSWDMSSILKWTYGVLESK